MPYNMQIEDQPSTPVLCVRTRCSVEQLPQTLGQIYGEVGAYLEQLNEKPAYMPYVAYFNFDMQNLEIEAGFPVSHELPGQGRILSGNLPAGRVGSCMFEGPYQELNKPYDTLNAYIKEQGCQATGVAYEFYFNDPSEPPYPVPITRVMLPLVD